ncbi:MAG: lipopolysaccharide biosynthesis protein [Pseudoflavonifractor sp.]|nr:lipopolysaccharide biosynthesis protein [Alloprevotella sp.]MCM1116330.1 lipopolysaccharide biosynthesis protein [Pseudoflavonifractor sp.]
MSRSQVFIGVIWASTQRFGAMLVNFVANLVLARFLSPDDFGLIGMLMIFMAVANVFIDSGFGSALIQDKNAGQREYSTAFIINISISLAAYLIIFLAAPLIARFNEVEIITPLLRIEGLALIANALSIVQTSILRKRMDFKRLATANLAANVVGTILAIVAASLGMGVWSLVVRVVAVAVLTGAMLWRVSEWRPTMEYDRASAKKMFSFGGFIFMSSLLHAISNNAQLMLIGKIFHPRQAGLYNQANIIRNSAADGISQVISQVLYPDYSRLDSDLEIIEKLNRGFYIISYLTTSLMIYFIIMAKPLILWLFKEEWVDSVPFFQILCFGGIFSAIQDINYYVAAAKGKSKILFVTTAIKLPFYVAALWIVGKMCGIMPMVFVVVSNSIISYLIFSYIANRLLHYHIWGQLWSMVKSLLLAAVPAMATWVFDRYAIIETNSVKTILGALLFFALLCVISLLVKAMPFSYVVNMIRQKL